MNNYSFAALIGFLVWASPVLSDPVPFVIRWNGPSPVGVAVDDGGAGLDLNLDRARAIYQGPFVPSFTTNELFAYIRLVASYSDGEDPIPLRLGATTKAVALRLFRAATLTCDESTVREAESKSMDPDEAVRRYEIARNLYLLQGPNRCGPVMKARLAKAWFDRAYALTQIRDYYRLDEDAADAYRALNAAYVDNYVAEARAHEIKLANDYKKALAGSGDYAGAAAVNTAIVRNITADPKLSEAFTAKQRLPLSQLTTDGNDLSLRARTQ